MKSIYYAARGKSNRLICVTLDHELVMTDEECLAFDKVKNSFYLYDHWLDALIVQDNYVSFHIPNGSASYIYSVNNEIPTFITSYKETHDRLYVRKITDYWYFSCVYRGDLS